MTKQISKKGQRLFSLLLTVAMIFATVPMGAFSVTANAADAGNTTEFAGGSGTAEDPYLVSTVEHLYNVRYYMDAHFKMTNDIDLTEATAGGGDWDYDGSGWNPIGSNNTYAAGDFSGEFDGNDHKIIGMRISVADENGAGRNRYIGLFASVTGCVHSLNMEKVKIYIYDNHTYTTWYAGALTGQNKGKIARCYVSGSLKEGHTDDDYFGGIAGQNSGEIEECVNTATLSRGVSLGGISGSNSGIIKNCYNTGNLEGCYSYYYGYSYAYGIAPGSGSVINCYSIGQTTGSESYALTNSSNCENSYYLSGIGKTNSGATSLTEAQMKLKSMYSGFDFENVWTMGGDPDYLYPELQAFALSGKVGIEGDVAYLSTVTVDISQINKIDETFTYEWFVDDVSVGTENSYTVAASDIGKKLSVKVTGTKEFNEGTISSDKITVSKAIQTASVLPSELLSADDKAIEITTVAEQEYSIDNANWQKNGVFENLDPNKTYTIYSRISENDLYLTGESVKILSVTTDRRPLTGVVNITGTSRYGDTVKADVSGVLPVGATFSYEWKSGDKVVGTGKTYAITKSDIGKNITLSVIGTGDYIGTLTSAPVAATKASVQNPSAPVVSSKTNTSVTLVTKTGYEYSKDKVVWQDSPVFSGLSAATEYTFYQRAKETETTFASVSSSGTKVITLKNTVTAPANPVVEKVTNTTVTLKAIDGYEYSMDGLNWQTSNVFKGLEAYTEYSFCQRIAENKTDYASAQSGYTRAITLKNTVSAPAAPKVEKATETSVTLVDIRGYEYSKDGTTWQSNNVFTGLTTLETYTFYQRIKETTSDYASAVSAGTFFKVKYVAEQPDAPVLKEKTNNKIAVEAKSGYEYSINKTSWNTTGIFTGLQPNQTYSVYCRVPETDTHYASAESDGLSVTTLKNTTSKPSAPTVSSKTSTSVTLVQVSGAEYSKDGTTWQKSNVFSGLSPNKTYTFYQRIAETTTTYASEKSAGTTVTTPKNTVSAPSAPTLSSKTANSVTLVAKNGYEYSKDGSTWQDSNVFNNLKPNTTYNFYQRVKETDTSYASGTSTSLSVTTPKRTVLAPSKPSVSKVTQTSVTLTAYSGYEYSMDGKNWQTSNVFTGLSLNTTYTFYQRVAETNTSYVSEKSEALSVTTLPKGEYTGKVEKPILVNASNNSISLLKIDGYEYKIGNGSWQSTPVFKNLKWRESYTLYQRVKETSTHKASAASEELVVDLDMMPSVAFCQSMLSDYIEIYGTTQSNGNKRIRVLVDSSYDYLYLENTPEGIYCSTYEYVAGSSTSTKYYFGFTITPDSKYINPTLVAEQYYGKTLVNTVVMDAIVDRTTYTLSSNIHLDDYQDGTVAHQLYNSTLLLVCVDMYEFLLENTEFGIGGVGFLEFSGEDDADFYCDAALNHQLGNKVLKYQYPASCERQGYTGDYCCSYCGEVIEKGEYTQTLGGHDYSNSCDTECNHCGFVRDIEHTYSNNCDANCNVCNADREVHHLYDDNCDSTCNECGNKRSVSHIYDDTNDLICNGCGYERPPYIAGDIDGDDAVTQDDAVYLLLHTMFGETFYPLNSAPADIDNNGVVNQEDAVYLLLHTMFGETFYPLKAQ